MYFKGLQSLNYNYILKFNFFYLKKIIGDELALTHKKFNTNHSLIIFYWMAYY